MFLKREKNSTDVHTHTHTHTHTQTDKHCNLETESTQWADSVKIYLKKKKCDQWLLFFNYLNLVTTAKYGSMSNLKET